ncbi:2-hydroxyacid dehydrogenase [uncultured Bosea sp.]|uniref:2-hydroxyacid dehydrogenase n=1 Tax=uncultured Bosea sp. TaxID=211457 RepID=UPI00263AFC78|nr:2-hydroxyacid dehydrogenase [uncultured Bosea sp.]
MKPTILMMPRLADDAIASLKQHYTVIGPVHGDDAAGIPADARDARALVTYGGRRTGADLMDALPKLELIACYGTGVEGVDAAAAKARGIRLCNAADANARSVAEFAMGLMLCAMRGIGRGDRFVRDGLWSSRGIEPVSNTPDLAGRKIGIYGLGAIGARIASRAAAFEMEVGYHSRSPKPELSYQFHDSLLGLAAWADVLMVAVRASAETRNAVDDAVLDALGPEGYVANISRGLVIDEEALCAALEQKRIAGAALDVFAGEPHVPERLRKLENVVLTPHIAASSQDAKKGQLRMLLGNLDAFFAGRPLPSSVAL